MLFKVDIEVDEMIDRLTEQLEGDCYCNFESRKKKLKKLKDILEKRWDEPIDLSCIE